MNMPSLQVNQLMDLLPEKAWYNKVDCLSQAVQKISGQLFFLLLKVTVNLP